ncbi:MAG: hypothetical protein ACP5XB_06130 [Isosphaeraceae bacterium]
MKAENDEAGAESESDGSAVERKPWSAEDWAAVACWFTLALAARLPFLARSEGALDHDQSVVGLMALDIAAGRRLPIFFDGQRYMGAVEAYVAAVFTRLLGHAPSTVALAPLLFFALFVAGQFGVWRLWKDRRTGHLAALLTLFAAPLLTVWGFIPRGGYVESLAWALPTLAVYRVATRPSAGPLSPARQAGWGFLLALGYFINPLSQIVYVTLAVDWTFGCHGDDLRQRRARTWHWLDRPGAPLIWLAAGLVWLSVVAAFTHVDPRNTLSDSPYVFCAGLASGPWDAVLGGAGAGLLLAISAWWTRFPQRLYRALVKRPWFLLGMLVALSPFVLHFVLVRVGVVEPAKMLPVWPRAPWKAWPNIRNLVGSAGVLIGSGPVAIDTVINGQGLALPSRRLPRLAGLLDRVSPLLIAIVVVLLMRIAWSERGRLARLAALRGMGPSGPVALTLLYLTAALGLYLLQGTCPDSSSVRYLVSVWVALPGLLAVGILALPARRAWPVAALLVIPWGLAQWSLLADMDRDCPVRPLADELERRGCRVVVTTTPQALIVANLSHGNVGAVEYRPIWNRLGKRYLGRLTAGSPVLCVTDRLFPWAFGGRDKWDQDQDLEKHLRGLARRHPGHVRHAGTVATFDLWEVDLPLPEILALETDEQRSSSGPSLAASRSTDGK